MQPDVLMGSLRDLVARYDQEHEFLRQFVVPEEDRAKYTSAKWAGEYRWFRSDNVRCLEKYRQMRRSTVDR
jgi:hypothetical protein